MEYPNFISTTISNQDLNEILSAIGFIEEKLPGLLSLSDLEPYTVYSTKTESVEFVQQNLKVVEKNPEIVPQDVDIKEVRKDVDLIKSIDKIIIPLKNLLQKLEDSKVIACNEAYLPSIAIYNALKARDIKEKHKMDHKINA